MPPLRPLPLLRLPPLLLRPHPRLYSTAKPAKLAKPSKFTPPSHPSRRALPRDPINYPGPATASSPTKQYPHTMPPPQTLAHFILTSRRLHFWFSLSVLTVLGGIVSVSNFLRTNPYAHTVFWEWSHPLKSARSLWEAWRTSYIEQSMRVHLEREQKHKELEKRAEFRKEHGLDTEKGFGSWRLKEGWEDGRVREAEKLEAVKEMAVRREMERLKAEQGGVAAMDAATDAAAAAAAAGHVGGEDEGQQHPESMKEKLEEVARGKRSWWKFW